MFLFFFPSGAVTLLCLFHSKRRRACFLCDKAVVDVGNQYHQGNDNAQGTATSVGVNIIEDNDTMF